MVEIVTEGLKTELGSLCCAKSKRKQEITSLSAPISLITLKEFSWDNILDEVQEKAPITLQVLETAMPVKRTIAGRPKYRRYKSTDEADLQRKGLRHRPLVVGPLGDRIGRGLELVRGVRDRHSEARSAHELEVVARVAHADDLICRQAVVRGHELEATALVDSGRHDLQVLGL